jgi:CRP-like cAMP-binding protein
MRISLKAALFPLSARLPPIHRIEIGMVGYEGMSGLGIVLGDERSPNQTIVQAAGSAMRISAQSLREAMSASQTLSSILLRYSHVFMIQCGQTALANGRGRLDERLARWLLMWDDRIRPQNLTVTHEFLALLLGVRRTRVTDTMHDLEGRHLIRSGRGQVQILDRDGLKLAANGFYGIAEAEYERALATTRGVFSLEEAQPLD